MDFWKLNQVILFFANFLRAFTKLKTFVNTNFITNIYKYDGKQNSKNFKLKVINIVWNQNVWSII